MPGRTLASFYGNNGETSESPQQSPREPFYQSPGQESGQTGTPHQYDTSYYYPNVNQPTGYPSAQYAAPYSYSAPSQSSRHDSMSYPNSQGAYNASPGHYATPGHGQTGGGYAGGGQWPPQAEFAAPAPAHAAGQHALPGQFQRGRMAPVGGSPPVQHPAWTHTPPQAVAGGALAPSGYYPAPPQLAHRASADRQAWKPAHQSNGSPLFSLQMLVNQDLTRAAAAHQVSNYEMSETVDLSSTATPSQAPRPVDRSGSRNGRVSVPTPPTNGSPADNVVSSSSRPKSEPSSSARPKSEPSSSLTITKAEPSSSLTITKAEPSSSFAITKLESSSSLTITRVTPAATLEAKKPVKSNAGEKPATVDRAESTAPTATKPAPGTSAASQKAAGPEPGCSKTSAAPHERSAAAVPGDRSKAAAASVERNKAATEERNKTATEERNKGAPDERIKPASEERNKPAPDERNKAAPEDRSKAGPEERSKPVPASDERGKVAAPVERCKTPDAGGKARKKKVDSLLGSLAPAVKELSAEVKEEAGDDDRPRRKRKLDKPVRVAKSPSGEEQGARRRSTSEGSEAVAPPPPTEHEPSTKRQRRKSESDQPPPVKEEPPSSPLPSSSSEAKNSSFIEVESELEKMFAGMEEAPPTPPTPAVVKTDSPRTPKTTKRDRRNRAKPSKTEAADKKGSGKKANGKKKGKVAEPSVEEGSKGLDSGSNASGGNKIRGPLIRVRGETVNVYNAPAQAEAEQQQPRPPPAGRRKQAAYQSDLDYRAEGKLCASMFTSTLSARYDAHTTDRAWLCVFCKAGPHSNTGQRGPANGDLFGPYLVAAVSDRERDDGAADDRDLNAEQKRGGRNKKSLRKTDTLEQFRKKMSKKAKRAAAAAQAAQPTGMLARANGCYEVWTHESCALWAAGTRVVGSRVYGLQEAVWAALSSTCHKCTNGGATVSCAARGCSWRLHVDCAFALSWELDEESFLARCPVHRIKQEAGTSKG